MARIALADEKIVVVIAAQQNAVDQRGNLWGRARARAPHHAAVLAQNEARGMLARCLGRWVRERAHRDGDQVDQHGFGTAFAACVKRAGYACGEIRNQRRDFVG